MTPRLFVHADLAPGTVLPLPADQDHYLRTVLRLASGSELALFNGRDGEWRATITAMGRAGVEVTPVCRTREQAAGSDVWLVFAPLKRSPIDFVAQKVTELGADVLWPVITRHTAVRRVNLRRLRSNTVEAAEQSGRLTIPEVREPTALEDVLEQWPDGRLLFCCDETGAGVPARHAFAAAAGQPAGLLVGPEGGFTRDELDAVGNRADVCRVSLGPRILRADTAALAALACWQALAGSWTDAPGAPEHPKPGIRPDAT